MYGAPPVAKSKRKGKRVEEQKMVEEASDSGEEVEQEPEVTQPEVPVSNRCPWELCNATP
jgi:hypothetical protein